jgi:mannosyltransferase
MAIARPVRALALLAVILWCFFVYQVLKPSPGLRGPGDRYINFERDPNLDRESRTIPSPSANH